MTSSAQRLGDDHPDIADNAQEVINDAANHPWVEKAARVGYAANAVMHLLIGVVALRLATGGSGAADQGGALGMLTQNSWGKLLLGLGAFGWAALAFWQVGEACLSFHETKTRLKAVAKAITYAVLSFMCVTTLLNGKSPSSKQQNATMAGRVMEHSWGVGLVALTGAVVVGVGLYHVVKGVREKFFEDLQRDPGRWAELSGVVGYALKGMALSLMTRRTPEDSTPRCTACSKSPWARAWWERSAPVSSRSPSTPRRARGTRASEAPTRATSSVATRQ